MIKHRNHRELTVEQHRRFVTVAERLVPDPPPDTRTLAVDADGGKESKEMLDKLSKLKGSELDAAFLEWLSHIHHDTTVFDNEVKNGSDAELKAYAKGSIAAGNEHLKEARELLAKLKK